MIFSETLITIADKCPANHGMEPTTNRAEKTITMHQYDVLTEMPYQLTYKQLKEEVHRTRRGKEFTDEQLETYMMKRSGLCKIYWWGVHEDKNGKLALRGLAFFLLQRFHPFMNSSSWVDGDIFAKLLHIWILA